MSHYNLLVLIIMQYFLIIMRYVLIIAYIVSHNYELDVCCCFLFCFCTPHWWKEASICIDMLLLLETLSMSESISCDHHQAWCKKVANLNVSFLQDKWQFAKARTKHGEMVASSECNSIFCCWNFKLLDIVPVS